MYLLPRAAVLILGAAAALACGEATTAPYDSSVDLASVGVEAAAVPAVALASGLARHVESFSGVVPAQANFDLTLTCPSQMLAVSSGHFVGTDINAAQLVASKPVKDERRWNFVVFNSHLTARKFSVHVVCLK